MRPSWQTASEDGAASKMQLRFMTANEILAIAKIDRATRDQHGNLRGFQRQPIQDRIRTIASALREPDGSIPNPVIVALRADDIGGIPTKNAAGWVLDGQQRLLACVAAGYTKPIPTIVKTMDEPEDLRREFVAINNARPLPAGLVAEILSKLVPMPPRLGDETLARLLTELLNYSDTSPIRGAVRQQTNPTGRIRDTALVRGLRHSLSHGALSELGGEREAVLCAGYNLVRAFLSAMTDVFHADWSGRTPATSRLVHGTGIVGMLHAMDVIHALTGADCHESFAGPLIALRPNCAWTRGTWDFGAGIALPWNGLQNVPAHATLLSRHLERVLRAVLPANTR